MKTCTKCGETKPLEMFPKWGACKKCYNAYKAAYFAANPEKKRAKSIKDYRANPAKRLAASAAWRAANPEKSRAAQTASNAAQSVFITRSYVAALLGIPTADLAPELHEAYREQLLNKRVLRELNTVLKEIAS